MKQLPVIKEILKKFKLDNNIPLKEQKHILKAKKRTLIVIYKRYKKYSPFVFACLTIFFWLKRIGISLTFAKTYLAVILMSIVITMIASVAIPYKIYNNYFNEKEIIQKESIIKIAPKEEIKSKIVVQKKQPIEINYSISIVPFDHVAETNLIAKQVNSELIREVKNIKGKSAIINAGNLSQVKTQKVLMGSIIKLETIYRISVKIVDKASTKVILYATEQADSEKDIANACKKLSRKIAAKL